MRHDLFNPLTATEIRAVSALVREHPEFRGRRIGFSAVFTDEPDKARVRVGEPVARRARAMLVDRSTGRSIDVRVDLDRSEIVDVDVVAAGAAPVLLEEFENVGVVLKKDPRYLAALAERGITDVTNVQVDPWCIGNIPEVDGARVCGAISYVRTFPTDNGYAHPIEGVVAFVDLLTDEVIDVKDYGVRPLTLTEANYDQAFNEPMRTDVAPLEITQPEGVGFTIDGNELTWQKWRFRVSLHPLEGLVIHGLEYRDGEEYRSILHRGSVAEMVVPYGDAAPEHNWRSAFDVGEFGLGKLTNSLVLGCDCLGEIRYLDAVLGGEDGEPYTIGNAICIHEEDDGILWKHKDWVTDTTDVRRSRRLVVSSIATVGNYEYGFFWYFHQDGSVLVEAKLTGIVQTRAVHDGEVTPSATPIGQNLVAAYHQHIFSFRLDFEVDGHENSVFENDAERIPVGPDNPTGAAFTVRKTLLETEQSGVGLTDPQVSRNWTVVNRGKTNAWGMPVGYKLLPGWASATLLAQDEAPIAQRAGFTKKNVWVTPYAPDEMRSAGDYPNQRRSGDGLPAWTRADRSTVDTDVVVWFTLGVTHVPRAEDWPVMPVERAGFHLLPVNFFDRSPALDVPPSQARHCH
ncbi:primary-amine oxidase [Blastococcus sp. BMG 814]|uniref:Amine oxidase n=1 Tax=Blastococcus carthaginiensis TaxID=3050034 RepID=A0ABT9IAD5_9ACTN|nr:primary-amine oxidase [Blastococcus carthaginiensis]MDP5182531.1 primary-amine oxidase [Blastococcus carthaginiensis]